MAASDGRSDAGACSSWRPSADARGGRARRARPRRRPAQAARAPRRAGAAPANGGGPIYASPSARRLARELGVELQPGERQRPQGPDHQGGRAAGRRRRRGLSAAPAAPGWPGLELPPWPSVDFEKFGPVERVERSRIQRISAPNLARNWVMIPHVTHNDEADITELEAWRKQLNAEQSDVKVTMVSFLVVACVAALKEFPNFNSSLDGERAGAQALLQHRLRRRHARRAGRAGDQGRRPEGPARDRRRADRAVGQGARGQALAGRHERRDVHDLLAGRDRRHLVHADHQRARGGDPRRDARRR